MIKIGLEVKIGIVYVFGDVIWGGDKFMSVWGGNLGLSGVRGLINFGKLLVVLFVVILIIKFLGWKEKYWVYLC